MAFTFSKLLWAFASPGSLLAFLLAAGLLLSKARCRAYATAGNILCVLVAVCLLAIAVLPVGDWALAPLENRFAFAAPDRVDGIIVIGGDEKTQVTEARGVPTAHDSLARYAVFNELARQYPDAKLVFSGGSSFLHPHAGVLDADVARAIMADMGVPTSRMTFEKKSRNTYENAVFSADIMRPEAAQKWLLVTNAWHMPRAIGCFRKAGWNIYAAPAGYDTDGRYRLRPEFRFDEQMHFLTIALHEYVGLIAYRLMGRTSALWPG